MNLSWSVTNVPVGPILVEEVDGEAVLACLEVSPYVLMVYAEQGDRVAATALVRMISRGDVS